MSIERICFLASGSPVAQEALGTLRQKFGQVPPDEADVIVALGGDGFMLHTLHSTMDLRAPVYGMNKGSVGFLMNDYAEDDLMAKLKSANQAVINPLRMIAHDAMERRTEALAINEVSLLRERGQAAKIRILIDDSEMMEELICDGILVATPAGSTAYNLSAHGPILPISAQLMAMTPISAFRPRRWRGAILPWNTTITFEIREQAKRPVLATADHVEVRDVARVQIASAPEIQLRLLYDPGHGLEERLLREQFTA
ncbi:MAG: NAD kinase [Pseudomonadota bacterium]